LISFARSFAIAKEAEQYWRIDGEEKMGRGWKQLTHEIRAAPIRPEPMYPAGKVIYSSATTSRNIGELTIGTPPRILVDPPSLGNNYPSVIYFTWRDAHTDILNLGACDDL